MFSTSLVTMRFHFILNLTLLLHVGRNHKTILSFHHRGRFLSLGYHSTAGRIDFLSLGPRDVSSKTKLLLSVLFRDLILHSAPLLALREIQPILSGFELGPPCPFLTTIAIASRESLSLSLYIYIYICVCVCACV